MSSGHKRRLLLLIPTRTYRAEAFVKAAQQLPVSLSIASEEPSALSHLHPVALPTFPFGEPDQAATLAEQWSGTHPVHAVVAVDDQATLASAAIAERLSLPHNTYRSVYATLNKLEMRRALAASGVEQPQFQAMRFDQIETPAFEFPVVCKPLMLSGSQGVIRANNMNELRVALTRIDGIVNRPDSSGDDDGRVMALVEWYVDGWEVSVEGFVRDGEFELLAIFDKPIPLSGPLFPETIYVSPSRLDTDTQRRITEMSQQIVGAVGLTEGPVHIELRGNDRHVYPLELAARSIGGMCARMIRFSDGTSLEEVILQRALDTSYPIPPLRDTAFGVCMMYAPSPGIVVGVDGQTEARQIKYIDEILVTATPGRRVEILPERCDYVAFAFASASSAQDVEVALRSAQETINVRVTSQA